MSTYAAVTSATSDAEIVAEAETRVREVLDLDPDVELAERERVMIAVAAETAIHQAIRRSLARIEDAIW